PYLLASRALARAGKLAAFAVPLAALATGSLLATAVAGTGYSFRADATARTRPASARIAEALDESDPSSARILLAAVPGAPLACEFGARTGIANVLKPAPPFGWGDLWLLVRRYGITHVLAGDPEIDSRLPALFVVRKSSTAALWTIAGGRRSLSGTQTRPP